MELVKLKPATKDYVWGGSQLKSWGKEADTPIIAEAWELSCNQDGPSFIAEGEHAGKALKDVVTEAELGKACKSFPFFPVLNKLIDADKNLSVQVHPSDDYALKNENQFGKTEMWIVVEAKVGAGLYIGFKEDTDPALVEEKLKDGTILELLNFKEVHSGEVYFIPSGTVHAIGAGVLVYEIQQNSTLTYRLYDYGRLGNDGKPRPLHIEKALKVLDYHKYKAKSFGNGVLGECDYFCVKELNIKDEAVILAPETSFLAFTFLAGEGEANGMKYSRGDTFFLPAGKKALIHGAGKAILTYIPSK